MAFRKAKVAGTKTVLLHLLLCLLIFYSVYYMVGSICFGAFRLEIFDGLIPFDFKTEPSQSNSKYLVNVLSLELTYFISGLLFAAVVKRWMWDYAITVTLIHVALTSAGSGLFLMICNGQLVAYFACQNDHSYPIIDRY
uniref:Transmembrane protein 244 isoform X2 n=1 Tax=Geotrypetes seraphini TaxID=260995 RepID=A0A6P8S078_GEOSA|nr:transmembrane protein 244 isoform X2 [Geotrypetes seraphini]